MNLTALAATPSMGKPTQLGASSKSELGASTGKQSTNNKNQTSQKQSNNKKSGTKNDKNSRKSARLVVKTKVDYAKEVDE